MRSLKWLRRQIRLRSNEWLERLDEEKISNWQSFYYPMIMLAGLYLLIAADEPTKALADTLGPSAYHSWLALHFICPPATLIGRRYSLPPNEKVGARLQLIGDAGTLGLLVIYIACLFNTSNWGAAVYPSFYLFLGVPGGAIFTLRSYRRLRQVAHQ